MQTLKAAPQNHRPPLRPHPLLSDHTPYSLELPSFMGVLRKYIQFPCPSAFYACLTGFTRWYVSQDLPPHVSMLSSSLTGSLYSSPWPLLSAAALSGSHHRSPPGSHSLKSGCVILSCHKVTRATSTLGWRHWDRAKTLVSESASQSRERCFPESFVPS